MPGRTVLFLLLAFAIASQPAIRPIMHLSTLCAGLLFGLEAAATRFGLPTTWEIRQEVRCCPPHPHAVPPVA